MTYLTGTAGFMVGSKKWFELDLNCIEINTTFYRLPTETLVKAWNNYPSNVKLSIKASKYITHIKRLKDVKEAWDTLWNKIQCCREKIVSILFQLPPSFNFSEMNLSRIRELKEYFPKDINMIIEFRNKSWINPYVYNEMDKYKINICGTYIIKDEKTPNWVGTMPNGLNFGNPNSDISYMRIHGQKGFKGELTDEQMRDMYNKNKLGNKKKYNIIIFNNTFFKNRNKTVLIKNHNIKYAAVYNAFKMKEITATTT